MGRCERFLYMTAKLSEACAEGGVSRLVFASSDHVIGGYKDTPVALSDGGFTTDLPPRVGTLVKTSEGLIDSHGLRGGETDGRARSRRQSGDWSLHYGFAPHRLVPARRNFSANDDAAGTPKSGLIETDPEREHDLRLLRAMWLRIGILSVRFRSPPRRRLCMAVSGHRRGTRCPQTGLRPGLSTVTS